MAVARECHIQPPMPRMRRRGGYLPLFQVQLLAIFPALQVFPAVYYQPFQVSDLVNEYDEIWFASDKSEEVVVKRPIRW